MKNPVIETLVQTEERTHANGSSETSNSSLLELITERSAAHTIAGGLIVGKFAGFTPAGCPLVSFVTEISHEEVIARSMISLREIQSGSDVVLAFEHGDLAKPIVMGLLWQPENSFAQENLIAEVDGERITLTAQKEIVLRCGKASITLTQAGKVLIRGEYLSSHSSGVNRIKGGSVQIN